MTELSEPQAGRAARDEFVKHVASLIELGDGTYSGRELAQMGRGAGLLSAAEFRMLDTRNRLPDWVLHDLRRGAPAAPRQALAPIHVRPGQGSVTFRLPVVDADTSLPANFLPGSEAHPAASVYEAEGVEAFLQRFTKVVATSQAVLDPLTDRGAEALWPIVSGKPSRRLAGKSLLLVVEGSALFSHWMFDTLPCFGLLEAAGHPVRSFDHIVLASARTRFHRETLRRLGVDPAKIIRRSRNNRLSMDHCVSVSPLRRGFVGADWIYDFTRRLFGADGQPARADRRIFISRESATRRRVTNEAALHALLEERGFEVVQAENHSVAEFVRVMAETRVLLGPHGGGLANLAFMPRDRGGVVGELFGAHLSPEYWGMCCGFGFDYHALQGRHEAPQPGTTPLPGSHVERNNRDFEVAPERLRRMIQDW